MKDIKITIDIKIEGLDEIEKEEETVCDLDYNPCKTFKLYNKSITEHTHTLLRTAELCANTHLRVDGTVTVNQVFEWLGLTPIKGGDKWGWKSDKKYPDSNPVKLRLVQTMNYYIVVDFINKPIRL